MSGQLQRRRGTVSRADLIDLLPENEADLDAFAGIAGAFGFELCPERIDAKSGQQNPRDNASPSIPVQDIESQNGWTTFEPAPTQYWRVTGYHSKLSDQAAGDGDKPESESVSTGRSVTEILKAAGFDQEKALPFRPLAARNYLLTKLRAIAPTRSSASQLDIPKAVDRISKGEFLTSVPRKHRRVWGQNICVIQDRTRRLVPYWFDEDQVARIVNEIYPEGSVEVARLHDGHAVPEYCFPPTLAGLDWQPPAPGTLVLALTDLGVLAQTDREHQEQVWLRIGDQLKENQNPTIALVPLHANGLSDAMKQRWQTIHWQQTTQQSGSDAKVAKMDRLLEFLAPCIRLEPQLLREVRLLTRELQSSPELESLVWQHPLLTSQHSAAGVVNADIRDSLLTKFANLDHLLRRQVLEILLQARQTLHPAVHFEEVMSLDETSRTMVNHNLVELAEDYYSALAEMGDSDLNAGILAWVERCARRLPTGYALSQRLKESMLTLTLKTQGPGVNPSFKWMEDAIPTATDAKSSIRFVQRGRNIVASLADSISGTDQHDERNSSSTTGSLLGTIRCSKPVLWIHEQQQLSTGLTEKEFWSSGKKPVWVHRYGTDEYGPWCSFRVKEVEQKLRWIPPGEFLMGSPKTENGREQNEGPQHRVILTNGFWIFETPCTQSLWFAVTGESPSKFKGSHRPVESIAWNEAMRFSADLRKHVDGLNLTLPSEAQWEYACRGVDSMPDESRYGALNEVAWYSGNSGGQTHDVGQKKANSFGLYDTLGNVLEWCGDDAFRPYGRTAQTDPFYCKKGESNDKIVRGSDWSGYPRSTRAAYRGSRSATIRSSRVGFRLIGGNDSGSHPQSNIFARRKQDDHAGQLFWWKPRESRNSDLQAVQQSETPGLLAPVQNEPLRRVVHIPRTKSIRLESDCEVLSLDLSPPPPWAVASGRDRYGLWAEFELNGVRQRLRWIPPGQFLMGSANEPNFSSDFSSDFASGSISIGEQPQHSVSITKGFWMFDTPCTQQLWQASGISAKFQFTGDLRPAESVSFDQVKSVVDQINSKVADLHLRLPSEAEWEYSCRSGNAGDRYGELDEIAWYGANTNGGTRDVKQKKPNAWGLYDMLGNVWEWCLDGPSEYTKGSAMNSFGETRSGRVVRGGSWNDDARDVRSACRRWFIPGLRISSLGFRLLSSADPSPRRGDDWEQAAAWR